MKQYIIIIIFSSSLFCSCKKVVVLDFNNAPAQIVIQGGVDNTVGPYTIMINQSVNFYADNNFPAISGASVKINDGQGVTDSLTETSPGVYTTNILQGKSGNTYTLTVLAQGTSYTAVSTMPQPVSLDSITFQTTSAFGQTNTSAVANFQDPAGIKNYYQFIEYINGVQFTKNIFVFDDRLSNGKYINADLFTDSTYFHKGDLLQVQMNCIDQNVYNYLFELSQSLGNGAFNTSASPYNPVSNISNGALGYFSAYTQSSVTLFIP